MNHSKLLREISRKSKFTDNKLKIGQVETCLELLIEVVEELILNEEELIIKNFLKFETKNSKSKTIRNVSSGEISKTRDLKVPSVRLSKTFKEELKRKLNEEN